MRPGFFRREQAANVSTWARSTASFNEARLLPPGTGFALLDSAPGFTRASMRPGFFRREQVTTQPGLPASAWSLQ